jgi:hypothetical protein
LPVGLATLLLAPSALARPHVRRYFEPTDLELEAPGTVELDLQTGMVRGPDPWRVVAPDFELDLGLASWLELDVDGAYAIEGAPGKPFRFDHAAPDPLWLSCKLGLLDLVDEDGSKSYAVGAQVGPKLPTFPGGHGIGVEALLLGGLSMGTTQFAFNLGGFVDPAPDALGGRPVAVESGVSWDQDLDAAGRYSLSTDVSAVVFASGDPTQLQAAFGPTVSVTPWLDLSLTGLLGLLPGNDRYGLLFGFSPHFGVLRSERP